MFVEHLLGARHGAKPFSDTEEEPEAQRLQGASQGPLTGRG